MFLFLSHKRILIQIINIQFIHLIHPNIELLPFTMPGIFSLFNVISQSQHDLEIHCQLPQRPIANASSSPVSSTLPNTNSVADNNPLIKPSFLSVMSHTDAAANGSPFHNKSKQVETKSKIQTSTKLSPQQEKEYIQGLKVERLRHSAMTCSANHFASIAKIKVGCQVKTCNALICIMGKKTCPKNMRNSRVATEGVVLKQSIGDSQLISVLSNYL